MEGKTLGSRDNRTRRQRTGDEDRLQSPTGVYVKTEGLWLVIPCRLADTYVSKDRSSFHFRVEEQRSLL